MILPLKPPFSSKISQIYRLGLGLYTPRWRSHLFLAEVAPHLCRGSLLPSLKQVASHVAGNGMDMHGPCQKYPGAFSILLWANHMLPGEVDFVGFGT